MADHNHRNAHWFARQALVGSRQRAGSLGIRKVATGQECAGSPALPAPPYRNRSASFLSASPAPDPLFEVEHLGLGAESEPQQKLWREQRHMMAGGAIDLDEIAPSSCQRP